MWAVDYGNGLYLILFLIIFAETGLVFAPLLPGDSLLFATGALLAMGLPGLDIWTMVPLLCVAAVLGDFVNYHVGRWLGPKIFSGKKIRFLNPKHLQKTQEFYDKHGGKTIILARFVPIVRTYAPFVAGMGKMARDRFFMFNIVGGVVWITLFTVLGYFFGNLPAVKSNFQYFIMGIIVISVLPMVVEFLRARRGGVA